MVLADMSCMDGQNSVFLPYNSPLLIPPKGIINGTLRVLVGINIAEITGGTTDDVFIY